MDPTVQQVITDVIVKELGLAELIADDRSVIEIVDGTCKIYIKDFAASLREKGIDIDLDLDWTSILKNQEALKKQYFKKHGLTDEIINNHNVGSNTMTDRIEYIASRVHETNRQFCIKHNHFVDAEWNDLPEERRESTRNAVCAQLDNPAASPEASHERWMEQRTAEGWVYGPVKDPEAKTHPCLVPYAQLPAEQQEKDSLFAKSVARAAFGFDHQEAE